MNPKFINEQAQSKSIYDSNNISSSEIITEGQRTFVRLTTYGPHADPWVVIIPPGSNHTLPQYMAISYRTNSTSEGEFFVGSGEVPSGQGDYFMVNWVEGDWNFMVIDLTAVGLTSIIDNVINYARFDFLCSACGEDDYFDVQYIGFFNTAEYAENYNEEMSKASEQPTEKPEVPTADPADPLHVVEPDFLANYAAQTGNLACVNDVASAEVKTEAGRTFIRLIAGSRDPYIAFIDGSKKLKVARYMAVSYRTNSAKDGQFFMGSGAGWNGQGDCFKQVWNEDGNWNLAIIDLDSVGLTALTDYILNYARCDFFDGIPNEGDYFDIEYIAFFNTAEYAAAYDIEMHKVPMWYADKAVVAHHSFDMLYLGTGSADNSPDTNIFFSAGYSSGWDSIADMTNSECEYLTYWGWIGYMGELGQFGYQVNGGEAIYNAEWAFVGTEHDIIIRAAQSCGADSGNRMKITISLAGLVGENTVRVLYKDAEGNVVCLNEFTVIFPL